MERSYDISQYPIVHDRGKILVDFELQKASLEGRIINAQKPEQIAKTPEDEKAGKQTTRYQSSSYEPILGEDIFELPSAFQPRENSTIFTTIKSMPGVKRHKLDSGFVVMKNHTYAIPLIERIKLNKDEYAFVSPRSGTGRDFNYVRLVADHSPWFDRVVSDTEKERMLWLLVQPLAFSSRIYSGISLNQLRLGMGDVRLTSSEVKDLHAKHTLLYEEHLDGVRPVLNPAVDRYGLHLRLDLHQETALLIAKDTQAVIDYKKKDHKIDDFFYRVGKKEALNGLKKGQCALASTLEFTAIPPQVNAEMNLFAEGTFLGKKHLAGFFDNNFGFVSPTSGVFEIVADEPIELYHGIPVSSFEFFATGHPEILYGDKKAGSEYQGQRLRPSGKFIVD